MKIVVAQHPSAAQHDTGERHPERPERVEAVRRGINGAGLDVVDIGAPAIERAELALVHDASYIEMIEAFCAMGGGALDMDTVASEATWEAALTAAGGVKALTEELRYRSQSVGFAVARPPGHHALADRAMGFCLFNNVAVTAALLRSGGERVAIIDWDVHHGNGTQALVQNDEGVLYVSIHQDNFYPFTGFIDDIDLGDAKGTTVNIPLPERSRGDIYRIAWSELVLPVVAQFAPDWVLISAGYDAHISDPLALMELTAADYGWMSARLAEVHPVERTVVALEGGYDLEALEQGTAMTLLGFAGISTDDETGSGSPPAALSAIEEARAAIRRHWSV